MAAAVLGITGAPFFIGSISKYFISYQASPLIMAITIAMSLGTIVSFVKFSSMFLGKSESCGDSPKAEICKTIPVAVMGAACLAGGIFGTQLIHFLFRYTVDVNIWSYAHKSVIFIACAGSGFLIFKYIVLGNVVLGRLVALRISFKSICAAMGVFLAVMLVLMGWVL
jgi:multicomponent Na+:H+ antiporter subunit D